MDRYGSGSIDGYQRDRMGYQDYDGRVYEQDRCAHPHAASELRDSRYRRRCHRPSLFATFLVGADGPYRQGYGSRYNRRMAGPWDDGPYDDYNDYYSGGRARARLPSLMPCRRR